MIHAKLTFVAQTKAKPYILLTHRQEQRSSIVFVEQHSENSYDELMQLYGEEIKLRQKVILKLTSKERKNKVVALGNPSKVSVGCSNYVLKQKLINIKIHIRHYQNQTKLPVACLRQLFRLILRLICLA